MSAKHHSSDRFKLGLSQYSLRALLKNGSLDALDFPQFTVDKFGIQAIDLWEGGCQKTNSTMRNTCENEKAGSNRREPICSC